MTTSAHWQSYPSPYEIARRVLLDWVDKREAQAGTCPSILQEKPHVRAAVLHHWTTLDRFYRAYGILQPHRPQTRKGYEGRLTRAWEGYRDLLRHGSLRKAARRHQISHERLREILMWGAQAKLFHYPIPRQGVTPQHILRLYRQIGDSHAVSTYLHRDQKIILATLRQAGMNRHRFIKEQTITRFRAVNRQFHGRLTAYIMQQDPQLNPLYDRIRRYCGGLKQLRKTLRLQGQQGFTRQSRNTKANKAAWA